MVGCSDTDPSKRALTNDYNHRYYYDAEERLVQVDGTFGNCSTAIACAAPVRAISC